MTTIRTRARLAVGAAVSVAVVLVGAPAGAHVEPSPAAVAQGTSATISFGVEHGCEDSATTKVEIQVPDEVKDLAAAPGGPEGWTGTVDGVLVTFEGPAQPADEGFEVALTGTFPDQGDRVPFPLIQTCETGTIDWIDPVVEGQEEPEHPAPTVTLTAGTPTEEQAEGGHDEGAEAEGDEHAGDDDHAATTAASDTSDDGDASIEAAEDGAAADEDDGGTANTGLVIGGAIAAVVVLAGIAAFVLRRKDPSGPSGDGQ